MLLNDRPFPNQRDRLNNSLNQDCYVWWTKKRRTFLLEACWILLHSFWLPFPPTACHAGYAQARNSYLTRFLTCYSQIKWSVLLKIALMNWLFETLFTRLSFQECKNELIIRILNSLARSKNTANGFRFRKINSLLRLVGFNPTSLF